MASIAMLHDQQVSSFKTPLNIPLHPHGMHIYIYILYSNQIVGDMVTTSPCSSSRSHQGRCGSDLGIWSGCRSMSCFFCHENGQFCHEKTPSSYGTMFKKFKILQLLFDGKIIIGMDLCTIYIFIVIINDISILCSVLYIIILSETHLKNEINKWSKMGEPGGVPQAYGQSDP